ncbi:MAG: DNA topoisomerase IB [Chloroflexota bacterium]|nr:DNA topoisomerase IB [Chloroflexota bacterium]
MSVESPERAAAREAGLRYIDDTRPGIRRRRAGRAFTYLDTDGRRIRDPQTLARIRALAIPPAWTAVWISPDPRSHIQATGRDARGRKQYRYHARWRAVRDEAKYGRMIEFAKALPAIRARTSHDLALPGLPREKVLAIVVQLLEKTLIRVGNEEYARENRSFGLTTLRTRHVDVEGSRVRFHFRGKGGKEHNVDVADRRLAGAIRRCQELPGQELFQYEDDDGQRRSVDSGDVNDYLREITGSDFTAKDFRTWAATRLAALALQTFEQVASDAEAKRNVVAAIESVSRQLGNTPAICRRCYVHPAVIDAYMDGSMARTLRRRAQRALREAADALSGEERAVMSLLERRLAREAGKEPPRVA